MTHPLYVSSRNAGWGSYNRVEQVTQLKFVNEMPPKKNNKKNKNMVRVQLAPAKKKKSSSKKGSGMSFSPVTKQYMTALADPFNERACGARVPDQYSCHTTTFELRATHTVTAGSSGNVGVWVLPNVVTALVVPDGTFPGGVNLTWLDNTTTLTTQRWGFDSTTLGSRLQNYRVVGMGVRVTNMSSMTNSQGKFVLGSYPINAYYVTRDYNVGGALPTTNAAATRVNTLTKWGVPMTGTSVDYASLVNYPGTKVLSALEVAEGEFDIIPKPCQPSAFEFREPNDSYQGFGLSSGTATGDPSYLKLDGFEACFVTATGLVASTSAIDIEIVYHIEGAPQIAGGAPSSAFVNQQGTQSPTDMQGFMKAIDVAMKLPAVRKVAHVAADFVHPILGQVARAIF